MKTETPAPAAVRLYRANLRVKDRPTYLRSLLRRTGRGPYLSSPAPCSPTSPR